MKSKYFVLLPDGIGLRNFAYTSFNEIAKNSETELIFWNSTPFNLIDMGYNELKAPKPKLHKLTDIYKVVRKNIEITLFKKKTKDNVYDSYLFLRHNKTLNAIAKNVIISWLTMTNKSENGLEKIRRKIKSLENGTAYFNQCINVLKKEQPDILFCTNQRPVTAIAPIEAAKSLGIPTATFIFSWDNLPKATIVIETDYYFVWSEHMKEELLFYYPYIKEDQILVTGTPQFEGHFSKSLIQPKEHFFQRYDLDLDKKYICFSGDDITTSPNDAYYLEDTAKAVKKLNDNGHNIGIVFRRCPVDFSDRYDFVMNEYKDIIVPIAPKWEEAGSIWNAIMPTKDDTELLVNTAEHTELVINVGSSMVFDYISHDKPCAFINYDTEKKNHPTWTIENIYKFVHFRSMPDKRAVYWVDGKHTIAGIIENAIHKGNDVTLKHAKDWYSVIAKNPLDASKNIWNELNRIVSQ